MGAMGRSPGFRIQGMRTCLGSSMLVQEGDDGLDVVLLDDVQDFQDSQSGHSTAPPGSLRRDQHERATQMQPSLPSPHPRPVGSPTRRPLAVQLADQPIQVVREEGTVGTIATDQRG